MDIRRISDDLSVGPQIAIGDLQTLAENGFRAVICNRPDGEGADQPVFQEIERAAQAAGLEARYVPVTAGKVGDDDVAAFAEAMRDLPGPVLAYCRTGTRSTTLWSLSQAGKQPVADILASADAAGYDMAGVARRIANGGKTPTEKSRPIL